MLDLIIDPSVEEQECQDKDLLEELLDTGTRWYHRVGTNLITAKDIRKLRSAGWTEVVDWSKSCRICRHGMCLTLDGWISPNGTSYHQACLLDSPSVLSLLGRSRVTGGSYYHLIGRDVRILHGVTLVVGDIGTIIEVRNGRFKGRWHTPVQVAVKIGEVTFKDWYMFLSLEEV